MATRKTTPLPRETAAIRRDRRDTMMAEHFDRLTVQLRGLASGTVPLDEARRIRDRYARSIGVRAGVGGDLLIAYLANPESAAADIEDIDADFMALDDPSADVHVIANSTALATAAIARGRAADQ